MISPPPFTSKTAYWIDVTRLRLPFDQPAIDGEVMLNQVIVSGRNISKASKQLFEVILVLGVRHLEPLCKTRPK